MSVKIRLLLPLLLTACSTFSHRPSRSPSSLYLLPVHSDRGAAHLPENMMSAFHCAAKRGADVLEMSLQITKDDKIIVARDPYFKKECRHKTNNSTVEPKSVFFRDKNWNDIEDYQCSIFNPSTGPTPTHEGVASLEHALESLRRVDSQQGTPLKFNLEIKYDSSQPHLYPLRAFYARHLMTVLADSGIDLSRIMIQSSDVPMLEEVRKLNNLVQLVLLVADNDSLKMALQNAKALSAGWVSAHYRFVDKKMVDAFHDQNIKVIPWTVNSRTIAQQIQTAGVDAVITENLTLFRDETKNTCP